MPHAYCFSPAAAGTPAPLPRLLPRHRTPRTAPLHVSPPRARRAAAGHELATVEGLLLAIDADEFVELAAAACSTGPAVRPLLVLTFVEMQAVTMDARAGNGRGTAVGHGRGRRAGHGGGGAGSRSCCRVPEGGGAAAVLAARCYHSPEALLPSWRLGATIAVGASSGGHQCCKGWQRGCGPRPRPEVAVELHMLCGGAASRGRWCPRRACPWPRPPALSRPRPRAHLPLALASS